MQTSASDRTSTWVPGFPAAEPHFFGIEWNAENQLTRVLKNAVEQARFAYDPRGRRVEKVAGGVNTNWTYDRGDILREIAGSTTLNAQGPATDEPLAQEDGTGALTFLHADGLRSVLKNTSAAGAVTSSRRYDAFGSLELGATNGYAFTGREWDGAVGLAYYRARYYDPKIGRFISEDLIQFDGDGTNFYAYAKGNPVRWRDPSGLKIQLCNRDADLGPIPGNHSYLYNPDNGENCGRGSQSGQEDPTADPGTQCIDVPGTEGRERQILTCCEVQKVNAGLWSPPINDCHQLTRDALECGGIQNPPSAPGGRLGCPTCQGGERPQRPPLPRR